MGVGERTGERGEWEGIALKSLEAGPEKGVIVSIMVRGVKEALARAANCCGC